MFTLPYPPRAICSTLIAQAFQSIHYPILPITAFQNDDRPDCPACVKEVLLVRHHCLFWRCCTSL